MPVIIVFTIGVCALGVATAFVTEGAVRTLALMLEAFWYFIVGRNMISRTSHLLVLFVPSIIPILLSLESIQSPSWQDGILHLDALVILGMATTSGLIAWHVAHTERHFFSLHTDTIDDISHTAWIIASLYGAVFVWLFAHVLSPSSGPLLATVFYAMVGTCGYIYARVSGHAWRKGIAVVTAGLFASTLFVVDLHRLEIATALGLLLFVCSAVGVLAWLERHSFKSHRWWVFN